MPGKGGGQPGQLYGGKPYDCATCGQTHPRGCRAHRKHLVPLTPCSGVSLIGTTVCRVHGGNAKQVKAAGAARAAEKRAEAIVTTYGIRVQTTATEALLDEIQWTAGHVQWLRGKVQAIEGNDLVWGETKRTEKMSDNAPGSSETVEAAEVSIWLTLYQRERAHLVKVCAEAIRAGIEERKVRLAEQQGQLVADVIQRILDDLGLTDAQQQKVPEIVPRHLLRLVS